MLRIILHQIWNQRRQNLWIWLELAVLSAFLWIVLDPLFTMLCIKQIPNGFDRDRIQLIHITYFPLPGTAYRCLQDSTFVPRMNHLLTRLETHPMVEAACLVEMGNFPGGWNWNGSLFYPSLEEAKKDDGKEWKDKDHYTYALYFQMPFITGLEQWTDMTGVFGLRDAMSGQPVHVRPDALAQNLVYTSAQTARRLHGTVDAKDSTVYRNMGGGAETPGSWLKIDAVYADIKGRNHEIPFHSIFIPGDCNEGWLHNYGAAVRLREGVDAKEFARTIQRDVLADCASGPVKRFLVTSLKEAMDEDTEEKGANNVVRLQSALGFFGLLCVFLGLSGLFWVRCGERRQDLGLLRAVGASRHDVCRQMMLEATLLLTAAFAVAMVFVAWYVHTYGFNVGLEMRDFYGKATDQYYWFLRPLPHVAAVTLLSYALMLVIGLLATWIPVQRSVHVLPCDALRDE